MNYCETLIYLAAMLKPVPIPKDLDRERNSTTSYGIVDVLCLAAGARHKRLCPSLRVSLSRVGNSVLSALTLMT